MAERIDSRSFSTVVLGSIPVAVGTRDHNWISFLSSFLTVLRWFPRSTPVSSTWQNCERQNSKLIISWFGRYSACLLSLTKRNRAGSAVNRERLWVSAIAWIKGRCNKYSALLLLLLLLILWWHEKIIIEYLTCMAIRLSCWAKYSTYLGLFRMLKVCT